MNWLMNPNLKLKLLMKVLVQVHFLGKFEFLSFFGSDFPDLFSKRLENKTQLVKSVSCAKWTQN